MRLGVLDIGSNTGHLLVVDADGGAAPLPAFSYKQPLRLAEHLDESGAVSETGIDALTSFTAESLVVAEDKGCEDILAFATSAVRDSVNSDEVLDHVHERTGVRIEVLSGEDEARLTFLAVRRWFGWSAGRLAVFDIGGGSLEIAGGSDEAPDVAWSLPLGAARLARQFFGGAAPDDEAIRRLRRQIRADIARDAGRPAARRRARPGRRDVQDVPVAGPDLRGGAVRRRRPGAADAPARASCPSGSPSWSRCRRRSWRRCRASRRAAPTRSSPARSSPRRRWTSSTSTSSRSVPWALREGVILERLDQISVLGHR